MGRWQVLEKKPMSLYDWSATERGQLGAHVTGTRQVRELDVLDHQEQTQDRTFCWVPGDRETGQGPGEG